MILKMKFTAIRVHLKFLAYPQQTLIGGGGKIPNFVKKYFRLL